MISYARELRTALDEANGDVDLWTARQGVELRRMKLKHDTMAITVSTLFGPQIILRKGLSRKAEIASVAHELCHDRFHADCVAYRDMERQAIERNERQAEMFAGLVVFPSIEEYETHEAFRAGNSRLPENLIAARLEFRERYGW